MKMRNRFTLLEVIVAMFLLAVFCSALLWQFSMAVKRSEESFTQWEQAHELAQAAEQLLLIGPDGVFENSFMADGCQVEYSYDSSDTMSGNDVPVAKLRLSKLTICLRDGEGSLLDQMSLDVWTENR